MKKLLVLAALLPAAPAYAHGGVHLHPHGYETAIGLALATVLDAALALRRSR